MASEFELIAALRRRLPASGPTVLLGPGDDAALIEPPRGQGQVLSTDTLVADRHFPGDLAPALLAWRALAVNLSDLAAMGAEPGPLLVALTAPDLTPRWIDSFCDGVLACLAAHAPTATLVGGNLARGPLQVSVTVTGWVPPAQALLRSGARAGDRVFVSGVLGAGLAGRAALASSGLAPGGLALLGLPAGLAPYLMPEPRVALGLALRGKASACIDISDGLVAELDHLAAASGVGLRVDPEAVPRVGSLEEALTGGDDYELLFTLPPTEATAEKCAALAAAGGIGIREIGVCEAKAGLRGLPPLGKAGWDHFSEP